MDLYSLLNLIISYDNDVRGLKLNLHPRCNTTEYLALHLVLTVLALSPEFLSTARLAAEALHQFSWDHAFNHLQSFRCVYILPYLF